METNIIFLNSPRNYGSREKDFIMKSVQTALDTAAKSLTFDKSVNVTIRLGCFGGRGTEGFAMATDWIHLSIPAKFNFDPRDLTDTTGHEMFHLAEGYCGANDYGERGDSLLTAVVAEGLAVCFAEKLAPKKIPVYASMPTGLADKWLIELSKRQNEPREAEHAWFSHSSKPPLLIYKIGKTLVERALDSNPGMCPQDLIGAEPHKLLKLAGIEL